MKAKRRPAGEGSVERLPSGRYRVRVPTGAKTRFDPHETFATWDEADQIRGALVTKLRKEGRASTGAITFLSYGELVLKRRAGRGIKDTRSEGYLFGTHLASAHFAAWPIRNIRRRDIRRWLDAMYVKDAAPGHGHRKKTKRPISRSVITNAANLLRAIFIEAMEDEYVDGNPVLNLKIRKQERTEDPWTYLTHEEQIALLQSAPERAREIIAIAICTGLRLEELWLLHLRDVHLDAPVPFITVRYGRRVKATLFAPKGKKIRDVPLMHYALPAMRAWLSRDLGKNKHGLVFPGRLGAFRAQKKALPGFRSYLRKAGIERHVRWHDLRHTCASSLVAGWWGGRAWRLEEVCAMLGHSSIRVTERYAHLAPSVLQRAAMETGARSLPALTVEMPALPAGGDA